MDPKTNLKCGFTNFEKMLELDVSILWTDIFENLGYLKSYLCIFCFPVSVEEAIAILMQGIQMKKKPFGWNLILRICCIQHAGRRFCFLQGWTYKSIFGADRADQKFVSNFLLSYFVTIDIAEKERWDVKLSRAS